MLNRITEYDFNILSENRKSEITFNLEQYFHGRLPSLSCSIDISDDKFKGWNINVWFEIEKLKHFQSELIELNESRRGIITLNSMSPPDFKLTLESINIRGEIVITYSIKKLKYEDNTSLFTSLEGSFNFDTEYFYKLIEDFNNLISVEQNKQNIDFQVT